MVLSSGARHPALWAAVVFAAGIFIADRADWPPVIWTVLAGVLLAIALLTFFRRLAMSALLAPITVALLLASTGGLRMSVESAGRPDPVATRLAAEGTPCRFHGRLTSIPLHRRSGWRATIDLYNAHVADSIRSIRTTALITTLHSLSGLRYGDEVIVPGRLITPPTRRNPGGFDYAAHLRRQGTDFLLRPSAEPWQVLTRGSPATPHNLVDPLRQWIRGTANQMLSPTSAAMMEGFLLGDIEGIPRDVLDAFRDAGTFHLLAVSGANVWLVITILLVPMRLLRIPRLARTLILILVITAFSFLTRNEPSVVRAALMAGLVLAGGIIHRPSAPLNSIGVAALIILAIVPAELFRAGFQLSFAAVSGIVVSYTRARQARWIPRTWLLRWLVLLLISTIAATVATAPILAVHFGTIPLLSLPANAVLVPLAGGICYSGMIALAVAAISPGLAEPFAWSTEHLLAFSRTAVRFFADFGALINWSDPSLHAILAVYLVGFLLLRWNHRYRWARPVVYMAVILATLSVVQRLRATEPDLVVAFLDVGRGRLAGVFGPNGDCTWIADDPGLTLDDRQWLTEPYLRAVGRTTHSQSVTPWRRQDSVSVSVETRSGVDPFWRRVVSHTHTDEGAPRVWADLFTWGADTAINIRDFPDPRFPEARATIHRLLSGARVLILPTSTPLRVQRELINAAQPGSVVFYGHSGWIRDPHHWLEVWRAHYPLTAFYFTVTDGAVSVEWDRGHIHVRSFSASHTWRDADYR